MTYAIEAEYTPKKAYSLAKNILRQFAEPKHEEPNVQVFVKDDTLIPKVQSVLGDVKFDKNPWFDVEGKYWSGTLTEKQIEDLLSLCERTPSICAYISWGQVAWHKSHPGKRNEVYICVNAGRDYDIRKMSRIEVNLLSHTGSDESQRKLVQNIEKLARARLIAI